MLIGRVKNGYMYPSLGYLPEVEFYKQLFFNFVV